MEAGPNHKPRLSAAQLLPNALTLGALCAGLTAIRFAFQGRFEEASGLIILAAALDGLDGRIARRLQSESAMGAELDSLCDFVNFGVAPALMVQFWAAGGTGGLSWIAALVYAVACALRLARFNIGSRDPSPTAKPKTDFTGVPSPAGALLALLPLFLANLMSGLILPEPVTAIWLTLVGALMVSRLPTPAFRPVSIRPDHARMLLVGAVALGAALLTYPWLTLVALDLGYLMLLGIRLSQVRRRVARKDE